MTICMATYNKSVIVDSSALVAILKSDDADHEKALQVDTRNTANDLYVLLPYEIVAETLNIIGKKVNRASAVEAGRTILLWQASGDVILLASDPQTLSLAIELQATAIGGPSYIDCLVMAHADKQRTPYVFGFDAAFSKNGYQCP